MTKVIELEVGDNKIILLYKDYKGIAYKDDDNIWQAVIINVLELTPPFCPLQHYEVWWAQGKVYSDVIVRIKNAVDHMVPKLMNEDSIWKPWKLFEQ